MSNSSDVVKAGSTENQRERWTSRWAFYFAAIGAAVGFGNVWRYVLLRLLLLGPPVLIRDSGHGKRKKFRALMFFFSWIQVPCIGGRLWRWCIFHSLSPCTLLDWNSFAHLGNWTWPILPNGKFLRSVTNIYLIIRIRGASSQINFSSFFFTGRCRRLWKL